MDYNNKEENHRAGMTITFSNINFGYYKKNILFDDLSFEFTKKDVAKGHIICLTGNSGSGKSTILNLILKNLVSKSGEIYISKKDPVISYMPQEPVLFDHLSPLENAKYFSHKKNFKDKFNISIFDELSRVLDMTNIFRNAKNVNELSGGERQRVSLIRALSIKPDILLLDEPTTGIDPGTKTIFLLELRKLLKELNIFSIYVTHHRNEAEIISDEIAFLENNCLKKMVLIDKTDTFRECPPTLTAASFFANPKLNVVKCKINNNNLQFTNLEVESCFAVLNTENLLFNNINGLEFKFINVGTIYSEIEIFNTATLLVETKTAVNNKFIKIQGNINTYSPSGLFVKSYLPKDTL